MFNVCIYARLVNSQEGKANLAKRENEITKHFIVFGWRFIYKTQHNHDTSIFYRLHRPNEQTHECPHIDKCIVCVHVIENSNHFDDDPTESIAQCTNIKTKWQSARSFAYNVANEMVIMLWL